MQFNNNWSPPFFHWQGDVPGVGTPENPTRKIFENPDVYEFATPFPKATYGAWYDPSHWYEGIVPVFNAGHQLRMLRVHFEHYLELFFAKQPALVSGFLILMFLGWAAHRAPIHLASLWLFLIPTIGALCLYAIVHVEDRFVGAFVSALWLVLFGGVHVKASRESKRIATAVTASVAVASSGPAAVMALNH
ncbi:MAG: hypothetical protein ACREIA_08965 [Opitutaceae bacterium]